MTVTYVEAPDIKERISEIVKSLDMSHIVSESVYCYRSRGSKSKHIIARIHGLGRIWLKALDVQPRYIVEVISEQFDKLNEEGKEKILIHELLHVPKGFSGGFRPHKGYINKREIERLHTRLLKRRASLV